MKTGISGSIGRRLVLAAACCLASMFAGNSVAADSPKTSCVSCHGNASFTSPDSQAIVKHTVDDVHMQVGLSCHDCHGGNPNPALAEDMTGAMDENYAPNPFRGAPKRPDIPAFCGRCHSSPAIMNRYKPGARVDMVEEYWTSKHGQLLKTGDTNVATCIDCHGIHGIIRVTNPAAPVYPLHVAETCKRCHADAKRMAGYKTESGAPIPVDQYARWRRSVHASALLDKGDLTAPTCNVCHGNHGAMPPGLKSITFVCGNCHGREAELFAKSPKHQGWQNHNDNFLPGANGECGQCHEERKGIRLVEFNDCIVCHENHGIMRPTVAILGWLPDTPCAFCHEGVGALAKQVSEPPAKQHHFVQVRDALLAAADRQHLSKDDRFDWLVDQALQLPPHVVEGSAAKGHERLLRPEFARLFEKFRIGRTHYSYDDPVTGKPVKVRIRQCSDCHVLADSTGAKTSQAILNGMWEVTGLTARAERILLTAQRGGVEVRTAHAELDGAVDSQIELEALIHSFSPAGPFAEKQKEGRDHAKAALVAGQHSLDELAYRRRGLGISLGLIVLVLIALAMKIRTLKAPGEDH